MEAHFGSLEVLLADLLAGWMVAGWLADGLAAAGWEACRILGDPRLRAPTKWVAIGTVHRAPSLPALVAISAAPPIGRQLHRS